MVLISCKKCGDINLTSEALGNLTDFGFKCRYCNTINRIAIEDGELKNKNSFRLNASILIVIDKDSAGLGLPLQAFCTIIEKIAQPGPEPVLLIVYNSTYN